jgi:hypothetical protein
MVAMAERRNRAGARKANRRADPLRSSSRGRARSSRLRAAGSARHWRNLSLDRPPTREIGAASPAGRPDPQATDRSGRSGDGQPLSDRILRAGSAASDQQGGAGDEVTGFRARGLARRAAVGLDHRLGGRAPSRPPLLEPGLRSPQGSDRAQVTRSCSSIAPGLRSPPRVGPNASRPPLLTYTFNPRTDDGRRRCRRSNVFQSDVYRLLTPYGQRFVSWSMRPWESARRPHSAAHRVPGSHGPGTFETVAAEG